VEISPSILDEIKTQVYEAGQVVIHFVYQNEDFWIGSKIRIWPSSYLYDKGSAHISELVHSENIVQAPMWQEVTFGTKCYFTLIFSGLPRDCSTFDFIEDCGGEGGGFEVLDVARNESDIYYFKIY
jgi:hypothetical protein|tara:strand:- start:264 stop:641 length:378 start_codon:yes stop_codon:yes gene_type:complete